MSGPKFVATLVLWVVLNMLGAMFIVAGVTENILGVVTPFGVVWVGLVTYGVWKFGNSSEGGR